MICALPGVRREPLCNTIDSLDYKECVNREALETSRYRQKICPDEPL
jgi:hypothetical protein